MNVLDLLLRDGLQDEIPAGAAHLMGVVLAAVVDLGIQMDGDQRDQPKSNGKSTDFAASKVLHPKNWMLHLWFTSKMTNAINRSIVKSTWGSRPIRPCASCAHV